MYSATIGSRRYAFADLATLLAKASPLRSGDCLAGLAAESGEERVAAQYALADLPLRTFLDGAGDSLRDRRGHAADRRQPRPGGVRADRASDGRRLARLAAFRCPDRRGARAPRGRHHARDGGGGQQDQPHAGPDGDGGASAPSSPASATRSGCPAACRCGCSPIIRPTTPRGIAASILDGLLLGSGDAVIGINPATDSPERAYALLSMLDEIRLKLEIPTQSCVLAHVTTTLALIAPGRAGRPGVPVDRRHARPPTRASASISRCWTRRARRRWRSGAAPSATT